MIWISITLLSLIVDTQSDPIFRNRRDLSRMGSESQVSNLQGIPWYGPPLPGMGIPAGFQPAFGQPAYLPQTFFYPPLPDPVTMYNEITAKNQAMLEKIQAEAKANECSPTQTSSEVVYDSAGKSYTITKSVCQKSGPNGVAASISTAAYPTPDSGSGSVVTSDSGSATSFASSSPGNSGPVTSAVTSDSGSGVGSTSGSPPSSGSTAFSNAGNGVAASSASG